MQIIRPSDSFTQLTITAPYIAIGIVESHEHQSETGKRHRNCSLASVHFSEWSGLTPRPSEEFEWELSLGSPGGTWLNARMTCLCQFICNNMLHKPMLCKQVSVPDAAWIRNINWNSMRLICTIQRYSFTGIRSTVIGNSSCYTNRCYYVTK